VTEDGINSSAAEIETDDPLGRKPNTTAPDLRGWTVRTGKTPFAVCSADEGWPEEHYRELHSYSGGVAWAVHNLGEEWDLITSTAGVGAYRLRLRVAPIDPKLTPWGDGDLPPEPVAPGVVVEDVAVSSSSFGKVADWVFRVDLVELLRTVHHNVQGAHIQLGTAVSNALQRSGVHPSKCEEFEAHWSLTRPTFTAHLGRAPTIQADLPEPWKLDPAFLADARQRIATQLLQAGIKPGLYVGDELKNLDNTVLAPAALALLEERLAAHDVKDICLTGLEQINRCVAASLSTARDIKQSAQKMDLDWDPIERLRENERDYVNLRMSCEACVEAAMRVGPTGTAPLDRVAWQQLIAAAFGYIEATNRSEGIHHQVTPLAVRITDFHEIEVERGDLGADQGRSGQRVYDFDVEAFQMARAAYRLGPTGTPPFEDTSGDVDLTNLDNSGEHPDVEGALGRIDAGMLQSFGCTAIDIVVTLQALALWPTAERRPSVAVVSRDQVIEHVLSQTLIGNDKGGVDRVSRAISMLTSTAEGLRTADWRPWQVRTRRERLLVKPLLQLSDTEVTVAPHYCHGSANAYLNYLTQGILPWSRPAPPEPLNRALADYRDERNRALERQVTTLLSSAGYHVRARVKPQDAMTIGLDKLEGEIDALAGLPGSDLIWLLEVKDPADVLVVSDIRRSLDRFYVGSKRERPYAEMLEAKAADVESRIDAVAQALDLPKLDDGRSRKLQTMFVTRSPNTAAFVGERFPFVTAQSLISYMRAAESESVASVDHGN
jgi:hypothetical protein